MTELIIGLVVIVVINTITIILLELRQRKMRKEFAIVEQLLTPFLAWIADVNKQRASMDKIKREKKEAVDRMDDNR